VYRYDASAEVVDDRADEVLEVKTGMFGLGKRLFVPLGTVQEVISDSVFLATSGLNADMDQFKEKPAYLDKLH
jgi:hypothetical protein